MTTRRCGIRREPVRGVVRTHRTAVGRAAVSLLALLVVAASCGSADEAKATRDSAAPTSDSSDPVPPAGFPSEGAVAALVDIGDGRSMHLECSGTGSPTVILIAGTGNAGDVWHYSGSPEDPAGPSASDAAVFPTTARSTRVCAYDRPDTELMDGSPGRSSSVAQPTSTAGDAADIHALLTAADVPGPYVLVAHSLGALMATTYARTYPDEVAGLVLIDPASQYMAEAMGPDAWDQYVQAALSRATSGSEAIDPAASNDSINALPPLPAMPVVILSSDRPWFILPFGPDGELVDYTGALHESQRRLAESLGAALVTKTSSAHDIYLENAPLVNQQICTVISPGR